MSNTVIRLENVSKRYQLGTIGYGSLQHDLSAWWARARGKEDPNTKIGEKSRLDLHGEFWALKNVSFDVIQGDRMGVIGRNGAGKSTLLKLLSRVTAPTTGSLKLRGRVASLLEVGTGFHPELTGRENVFLNGAILGMKRREIQAKFDEIIDFAGVDRFIDTPVKRYSSGMYVRLAFSVAAHLNSEVLIIDEVLAVGDFEFQKKCLGKMESLSRGEGKTLFFVSHSLPSILQLCNKAILLKNGQVAGQGQTADVIKLYRGSGQVGQGYSGRWENRDPENPYWSIARVESCSIVSESGEEDFSSLLPGRVYFFRIEVDVRQADPDVSLFIALYLDEQIVFAVDSYQDLKVANELQSVGRKCFNVEIPRELLLDKEYEIEAALVVQNRGWSLIPRNGQGIRFTNLSGRVHPRNYDLENHPYSAGANPSLIRPLLNWRVEWNRAGPVDRQI